MENLEGNIHIAKYEGYTIDNKFPDKNRIWRKGLSIKIDSEFNYHESYDALMPVVIKIFKELEEIDFRNQDNFQKVTYQTLENLQITCDIKNIFYIIANYCKYKFDGNK